MIRHSLDPLPYGARRCNTVAVGGMAIVEGVFNLGGWLGPIDLGVGSLDCSRGGHFPSVGDVAEVEEVSKQEAVADVEDQSQDQVVGVDLARDTSLLDHDGLDDDVPADHHLGQLQHCDHH